ncbi:MAG: SDR family oxidoreductase [Clostridiales Family XIII bacterium]|jgi:3-oxoacyl-[acyl-carrier protein] reductase|nr:SDR family oxidoreductase [Clostridiales Family XIII bacterium]
MGRTALITSGTAGIGERIVHAILGDALANIDAVFVNYGHDDDNAQRFLDAFSESDAVKIKLVKSDMSGEDGLNTLTDAVLHSGRDVDWLILNTGVGTYVPFASYDMALWNRILTTNVVIPAMLVQRLRRNIVDGGKILFMGSYAGIESYSGSVAYSASKAAVHQLAKSLVKEFDGQNICVNAVAPAFVETQWQENRSEESRARIRKKIAQHRFGEPREIAALCLSILLNDYINGTVAEITGGYNYF